MIFIGNDLGSSASVSIHRHPSIHVPTGWTTAICVHMEDFLAIMVYKNGDAVNTHIWAFYVNGQLCTWEDLDDDRRMKVRNTFIGSSGSRVVDYWNPGGYKSECYYALEALERL